MSESSEVELESGARSRETQLSAAQRSINPSPASQPTEDSARTLSLTSVDTATHVASASVCDFREVVQASLARETNRTVKCHQLVWARSLQQRIAAQGPLLSLALFFEKMHEKAKKRGAGNGQSLKTHSSALLVD